MAKQKVFGLTFGKDSTEEFKENEALREDELFRVDTFVKEQPRIDVLPPFVLKEYDAEALYKKVFIVLGAILVLTGLAFFGKSYLSGSDQDKIDELTAANQSLSNQVSSLKPYETYFLEVDAKRDAIYSKFAVDINYAKIYNSFIDPATGNGIQGLSYTAFPGTASCSTEDPFTLNTDVGCVTMAARTPQGWQAVHQFSDELNAYEGLDNAFFPTIQLTEEENDTGGIDQNAEFEGFVGFDQTMFNTRYLVLSVPLFEMISSDTQLTFDTTPIDTSATTDEEAGVAEDYVIISPGDSYTLENGDTIDNETTEDIAYAFTTEEIVEIAITSEDGTVTIAPETTVALENGYTYTNGTSEEIVLDVATGERLESGSEG